MIKSVRSFVFDTPTNISNKETFLQFFFSNSEAEASELLENLEKYFVCTRLTLMLSSGSIFQLLTGMLPVAKW